MATLTASFFSLMLVNLTKEYNSIFSYCYTGLGGGCSTRGPNDNFFRRERKHENTICVYFQFYNPKLSQEK